MLADVLGVPGGANTVWLPRGATTGVLPAATTTTTADELAAESAAGREAIVVIFAAIAAIVAVVSALSVSSTMAVNLHERRGELATVQALGGRRRDLRRLVRQESLALGAIGVTVGIAAGWWGNGAIIGFFEAANAVEIGTVVPSAALPVAAAAALVLVLALGRLVVRRAARQDVAVVLRGTA